MSIHIRTRPGNNARWAGSDAFHIKPTLEDGVMNWLGEEWKLEMLKKEGAECDSDGDYLDDRFPSVFEIMAGIQAQEKINQMERHKKIKNRKYVNAVIKNMLYIWRHIFNTSITSDPNK